MPIWHTMRNVAGYADTDLSDWAKALERVRREVAGSTALEGAASVVARELFGHFAAGTVLARVYAVVPYAMLEPAVATFVDELVAKTGEAVRMTATTPVLTLLGTHGTNEEWCDRTKSVGHRGIPLVSAAFVQAIPMVARLLKELGFDLSWLDAAAPDMHSRRLVGGFNGIFFVDDARTARDSLGRHIIPAQDFVEEQHVRTVFGMGGFYPDNTLIAIIVFARERIERNQVERLTSLISLLKGETFGIVRAHKFFR